MTTTARITTTIAVLAMVLAVVVAGPPTSLAGIVELDLPEVELIDREPPTQSFIFDADGNRLAVLRQEFRERIDLDDVPQHVIDAVLVAEDDRFYTHVGIDAPAIARAAVANLAAGEVEQGGSTITQQLIKNLWMPNEPRTPETKLKEALLARELEATLTKDEILEEYLNTVYFGNGAYGLEAAAFTYFRKPVSRMSVSEAALLAGVIRSPEHLNPTRNRAGAMEKRDDVLRAMVQAGKLDASVADREAARSVFIHERPPFPEVERPRWVDFVVRALLSDPSFGDDDAERAARLYGGGLRIHTTLRPDLQGLAEATRDRFLPDPEDPEVAIATVDPATGHILALVGGRDYAQSQFDLATQGNRQPGSTFKAFVLAAAVSSGMGPEAKVNGNQGVLQTRNGPWRVRNFARVSYGSITLEEATRASVNGAFARLGLDIGIGRVSATAHAMGIRSQLNEDPPISLGGLTDGVTPLEMASAYGTLANLGTHVPATPVAYIEDADGAVVWRPAALERRALDPSAAFVTTQMLQKVVDEGTGKRAAVPGWEVAGKTGTVQDFTDAWFVGYTPALSTAVWVGHPDRREPLRNIAGWRTLTGGSLPAQVFSAYMAEALAGYEPTPFHLPAEYYTVVDIDPVSGLLAADWCGSEERAIPRAIVPRERCPVPPPRPSPTLPPCPAVTPPPGIPAPDPGPCAPPPSPTPGAAQPEVDAETGQQAPSPSPSQPAGPPPPSPSPTPEPSPQPSPTTTPSPQPSPSPTASSPPPPEPSPTSPPPAEGQG